MKKPRVNNKERSQAPYFTGQHRMNTQTAAVLRPTNDIQFVAIEDMTLQGPVELVEIKARLQIQLAIKRIHRKRITVILIGRARSYVPTNHFFACLLGARQAAV